MIRTAVAKKRGPPAQQQGPLIDDLPPEVRLVQKPTTFRQVKHAISRTTTELLTAIELEIGLNNITLTPDERLSEIKNRVHGPDGGVHWKCDREICINNNNYGMNQLGFS